MSCCKLCLFEWDIERTVPRVLFCGHTFCEECIKGQVKSNIVFVCTQCQVQYGYENVRDAPINRTLLEYRDEMRQRLSNFSSNNADIAYNNNSDGNNNYNSNNNINFRNNNNNTSQQGMGDLIKQQLQQESMKKNNYKQDDRMMEDGSEVSNNTNTEDEVIPAEDLCMVADCYNKRVYKYGKKQVVCEKCMNKNSANIFKYKEEYDQNSNQGMELPYNVSPFMYYQQTTPSTNIFSTPNKTHQNMTALSIANQPQQLMNQSMSQNMRFSSPPTNSQPYQRILFQTPQYNNNQNNMTTSSGGQYSTFKTNQFNSVSDFKNHNNSLKTQLQF